MAAFEPFYLDAGSGGADRSQRFCIHHVARNSTSLGLVLYVHPFAEEMNKARRMAALQCRALAEAGYSVLQIDLMGCGDSGGDFSEASWLGWIDDVVLAARWLQRRSDAPLWLWGLRAGCLLAVDAAPRLDAPCNFLFWQPPPSGKLILQQFLRLKLVAEMHTDASKGIMDAMRRQLAGGESLQIAGYELAPAVAQGLDQSTLRPPTMGNATRVGWLEVSSRADASLSAASKQSLEVWRGAGFTVHHQVVTGAAFWQSSEIEEVPNLVTATLSVMVHPSPVA